jgi:hypothetical protein
MATTSKPAPKPFYTVRQTQDREFAHLTILVFYQPQWSSGASFEIVWQTDRNNRGWYGLHVATRCSTNEEFVQVARIIAKLELQDAKPESIIAQLHAVKIVLKQYHNGLHEYFSEADWPQGPTFRVYDGRQTVWAEEAYDVDAARRKFRETAGARIARGYGDHEFALRWLNEGEPVVESDPAEVWAPKTIEAPWAAEVTV